MLQTLRALAICLVAFTPSLMIAAPPTNADLPDLVENVLPGVVNISSTTVTNYQVYGMEDFLRYWGIPQEHQQKQTSLGTGFIIDQDGFILTNHHVVDHATEVLVTLLDKREFKARIVGKDPKMDLALLQIRDKEKHTPSSIKLVPLGDSDKLRIAESVFAVGNPFGLQHTVTTGIISAKNRTIGQGPFDNFLQTDASINPGNSGGPSSTSKVKSWASTRSFTHARARAAAWALRSRSTKPNKSSPISSVTVEYLALGSECWDSA